MPLVLSTPPKTLSTTARLAADTGAEARPRSQHNLLCLFVYLIIYCLNIHCHSFCLEYGAAISHWNKPSRCSLFAFLVRQKRERKHVHAKSHVNALHIDSAAISVALLLHPGTPHGARNIHLRSRCNLSIEGHVLRTP